MTGMNDPLLVGVDIGTTNIKAIVFNSSGAVMARASTLTPTRIPEPGRAYYDPDELWDRTVQVLQRTTAQLESPKRIASIAFASMGESAVPLDVHDRPTHPAIAWFDSRTKPQAANLDEAIGRDRLFSITGLSLSEIFGLCKILWLQQEEPDAYARTVKWLNIADYLAYRLSGNAATDYSLASRMLCLHLRNLRWSDDILAEVDVSSKLFALLTASGTDLGPVLPDVATLTGLPESARVAVGGHDHVCGALAAGIHSPGMALNSMGTAEVMFLPLEEPLSDPQLGRQGYEVGVHVDGEHYYVWGSIRTSGAAVDWYRSLFAEKRSYAELIAEAQRVSPGSMGVFFLPHLRSAATPHFDEKARGAFIGLTTDAGRPALFRAVLEGIAFEIRDTLQTLLPYTGTSVTDLYAIGGGTRNRLLMEIKASVLNTPIHVVDMEEAAALGAAMLGGVAAHIYVDIADAMSKVSSSRTTIQPDARHHETYETLFEQVYQQLYPALRSVNHSISQLSEQMHLHKPTGEESA